MDVLAGTLVDFRPGDRVQSVSPQAIASVQGSACLLQTPTVCRQPFAVQLSVVHALKSLQVGSLAMHPSELLHVSAVHATPSSQLVVVVAVQAMPAALGVQTSPAVQLLPSSQTLPSVCVTLAHKPLILSQESTVQEFLSSQFLAVPATHALAAHLSPVVQALLSSQAPVPASFLHPWAAQTSTVQTLPSSQALVPAQTPLVHIALIVQAIWPLQLAPSATLLCTQPVLELQPSVVHKLASSQAAGLPPLQMPPLHKSPLVQALPSSQAIPLAPPTCLQPTMASQKSDVQGFLSSHTVAPPPMQTPALHASLLVQALPSLQGVPSPARGCAQPLAPQTSTVQPLPSSQLGLAPRHSPSWQLSGVVHGLPSSQGLESEPFLCLQPLILSQ